MPRLVSPHVQHNVPHPHADLRQQRVQSLLETFLRGTRKLLREGSNRSRARKSARTLLEERGVSLDDLKGLAVGLLIDPQEMAQRLAESGFRPEEIEASKLTADPRLAGRLIGPIHDSRGHILSFWARHPEDRSPRYLYKGRWQEAAGAFGLDAALPALKHTGGSLLLVGDVLDAVLLVHHGFSAVAAIGGSAGEMTPIRWQRLAEEGVRETTLMLCGDRRSADEILAALEAAFAAPRSPRIYVAISDRLQQTDWVSDWYRAHGPAAFCELMEYRVHAYHYKALALLDEHRLEGTWTHAARFAALDAARVFYASQARHDRIDDLDRFFVPPILEELGLRWDATPEADQPDGEDVPEQDEREAAAPPAAPPPVIASVIEVLPTEERIEEVATQEEPAPVVEVVAAKKAKKSPSLSIRLLSECLPEHRDYLRHFDRRGKVGLRQRTIPALDQVTGGLRGLIAIGGPAGGAKTALALQLGVDVIRNTPDACLLFVSTCLSRQETISRLKSRLAGLNGKKLLQAYARSAQTPSTLQHDALEMAEQEIADFGSRALILDSTDAAGWDLQHMRRLWDDLKAKTGCPRGAVVIEGFADDSDRCRSSRTSMLEAFRDVLSDDVLIAILCSDSVNNSTSAVFPCRRFPGRRLSRLSDPAETELMLRRHSAAELAGMLFGEFSPQRVRPDDQRRWRATLARYGWIPHKLEMRAPRQPGLVAEMDLTFQYRTWGFREGLPKCQSLFQLPRPEVDWQVGDDADRQTADEYQAAQNPISDRVEVPSPTMVPPQPPSTRRCRYFVNDDCTLHRCGETDCFCFD